jgi:hypothetical protein
MLDVDHMKQSPIIVIINKKPYTLYTSDIESIRDIPNADRQQLVTLLEAIKQLNNPAQSVTQQVTAKVGLTSQVAEDAPDIASMRPERLRSGDADAVMAQLIMEEDLNKNPGLTKHSIYKWIGGAAVIIILLVIIL